METPESEFDAIEMEMYGRHNAREFLKWVFEYRKSRNPKLSHRHWSGKLGAKAPGHLLRILEGKARLEDALIEKLFTNFLKWDPKARKNEYRYFCALCYYTQKKEDCPEEKPSPQLEIFKRELENANKMSTKIIDKTDQEFFSKWYYPLILTAMDAIEFRGDYAAFASRLIPKLTKEQVKESIEMLQRLRFLRQDGTGALRPVENLLVSEIDTSQRKLAHIRRFRLEWLKVAARVFIRDMEVDKLFVTETFSLSTEALTRVKERIGVLRQEIRSIIKTDKGTLGCVYNINLQLFPCIVPEQVRLNPSRKR